MADRVSPEASRLRDVLTTRSFGRSIRWLEQVASTNTLAAAWAGDDADDGSVVCADLQTAGRGRFDRTWDAPAGENLTFSLILFPGIPADRLGMISVAFSVAIAATLKSMLKAEKVEIKWPNDILVDGRKICGILQESAVPSAGGQKRTVVGVGLNVNQTEFPTGIRDHATSLKIVSGQDFDRVAVFASLLGHMEDAYYALHTGSGSALRSEYEARLVALGREVTFTKPPDGAVIRGIVTGIDQRGGLVVSTVTGGETVLAGDVSFRTD